MSHRHRTLTLLFLLLAGLALLASGALAARHRFVTRGLPDGLPSPIPHGGPQLGLNIYLTGDNEQQWDAHLGQIRAHGVTHVKQPFYYRGAGAPYDWSLATRLVAAVTRHDLRLVPLLDGNPDDQFAPPADLAAFADWAGQFAARFREQVDGYIIWDEPNLASHWGGGPVNAAEYAALLTAAASAIRAADPGAVIVAAPLAPTVETGPDNLADPLYLTALYAAGAAHLFDVAAAKPYGFDQGPDDRTVAVDHLNFSRVILLREVMVANGDGGKAIWAGNWGWNALPAGWNGPPSIWGQTDPATQARWTAAALERARLEWPWLGLMFLENWQPAAPPDNPVWGFSIADRPAADLLAPTAPEPFVAYPGFHPARPDDPAQSFAGGWRFAPEFGADISQSGDRVTLRFWGTEVGARVRRADFRARFYATVDGRPANALPREERGAALLLTSAGEGEDYISLELIARDLPPGEHVLTLVADEGWDQWALNGFSVAYRPPDTLYRYGQPLLVLLALLLGALAVRSGRRADWGEAGRRLRGWFAALAPGRALALTAATAVLVALSGWLTWGAQAAGLYRRLGDSSQLLLTAAAATIFYAAPSFFVYVLALVALFILIYFRPAWGLALIIASAPFAVKPKPMLGYRFSPVEVFVLLTVAAFALAWLTGYAARSATRRRLRLHPADWAVLLFVAVATLSLSTTARLDVATNEWRVLIVEPALFYFLLRAIRPDEREMWTVLDAFVLGGLIVAVYGLYQYLFEPARLITAEGGLLRVRSIYGSPNNLALYLGRVLPLLAAVVLLGRPFDRRRWAYGLAAAPIGLALLLTFSKGSLFLGTPAALLVILLAWLRRRERRLWLWLAGLAASGLAALLLVLRVPALAARFNPGGETGFFRLNLWRASLNMIRDHPWLGVGLDNFLYAYRSRYIFKAAWQEPDLNHPHNIALDFATRLGALGLLTGLWLIWQAARTLLQAARQAPAAWQPVALGLLAGLVNMLAHGLVDHSFFLVDLSLAFYLMLGTAVWLTTTQTATGHPATGPESRPAPPDRPGPLT